MPQLITRYVLSVFYILLVIFAFGCDSKPNSRSVFDSSAGRHNNDWLPAAHMAAAKSDSGACTTCHGADFKGGMSGVSCTACHLGGPTAVHPSSWTPMYSTHGPYAQTNGTNACANQYCHGTSLTGVADSGPSCTSCHLGGPASIHPADWNPVLIGHGPYVKTNNANACANQYCHGTSLTGVANSGPSCTSCHLGGSPTSAHPSDWTPVYSTHGPYAQTNGTGACANQYCHGTSLTGVANSGPSCSSCHLGGPAAVHPSDWVPVYSSHGAYVKTNTTAACANQYCHGLPLTGVADSGPSCTSCHMGGITSGHPSDWTPVYSKHGPYAQANGTSACANQYCHGPSLTGVTDSGPSCSFCHLGGPAAVHPSNWTPVYSTHGPYASANGTGSCANQYCHGPSLTGVTDSGPSCTSCHMGSATQIHPAAWQGDACSNHGSYAAANGTAGCANASCHGANLGGVSQSGPSCTQCHNPIPSGCTSCHGNPPNGDTYPNKAGKHAKHMQLNNVTCATCHNRSCDQHNNGTVEVVFNPVYNAKTGVASFTTSSAGTTCSEISCHGGPRFQTPDNASMNPPQSASAQTPDWYTGSINTYDYPYFANAECTACHSYGTAEHNGFYSGKHFLHVFERIDYATQPPYYTFNLICNACHDYDKLSVTHFTGLNTPLISSGTASATLWDWMQYNGTTCTACHGPNENWWQ